MSEWVDENAEWFVSTERYANGTAWVTTGRYGEPASLKPSECREFAAALIAAADMIEPTP